MSTAFPKFAEGEKQLALLYKKTGVNCTRYSSIDAISCMTGYDLWRGIGSKDCTYSRRESWRTLVIQLLGGKFEGWLEGGNPVGHRVMLIRRPH